MATQCYVLCALLVLTTSRVRNPPAPTKRGVATAKQRPAAASKQLCMWCVRVSRRTTPTPPPGASNATTSWVTVGFRCRSTLGAGPLVQAAAPRVPPIAMCKECTGMEAGALELHNDVICPHCKRTAQPPVGHETCRPKPRRSGKCPASPMQGQRGGSPLLPNPTQPPPPPKWVTAHCERPCHLSCAAAAHCILLTEVTTQCTHRSAMPARVLRPWA